MVQLFEESLPPVQMPAALRDEVQLRLVIELAQKQDPVCCYRRVIAGGWRSMTWAERHAALAEALRRMDAGKHGMSVAEWRAHRPRGFPQESPLVKMYGSWVGFTKAHKLPTREKGRGSVFTGFGMDVRCDCGRLAKHSQTVRMLSSIDAEITGTLHLCDGCNELFREIENDQH